MSAVEKRGDGMNPSWITRFWAVVEYDLLRSIREKKFQGIVVVAFVLATLLMALPVILSYRTGQPLGQNPDYVAISGAGIGGLGFFLFAFVTALNSISGEFESGTIVLLLTKPVSRTMVFLGKLFASFVILLSVYAVLLVYTVIVGTIVYGPQNNLHLVLLSLLGNMLSTFVWVAIVFAIGSVSKSSLITALGAFSIFIASYLSASIFEMFLEQAWILSYVPGGGALAYMKGLASQTPYQFIPGMSLSTGTDSVATHLINYILHPSSDVTFFKVGAFRFGEPPSIIELYTEPLSLVLLRSITVAVAYVLALLFISWYAIKQAQVVE